MRSDILFSTLVLNAFNIDFELSYRCHAANNISKPAPSLKLEVYAFTARGLLAPI